MRFNVTIEMGNDCRTPDDIAAIMRDIAGAFDAFGGRIMDGQKRIIRDVNGHPVGSYQFEARPTQSKIPAAGTPEWLAAKAGSPRWRYDDTAGVSHVGYLQTFTDR